MLNFYGRNIVVSEGEEWKRFRKVSNPGFSEVGHIYCCLSNPLVRVDDVLLKRNNRMVWEETQNIVLDLFEHEWGSKKVVTPEDVLKVTVSVSEVIYC